MEQEHVDPVYKYIDGKIKLIKREIQQLKVAHDAVANKHAQMLLDIRRTMVAWDINSSVDIFGSIIRNQLSHRDDLVTQLIADAAAVKPEILASEEPFGIGLGFKNKWREKLEKLGANLIRF